MLSFFLENRQLRDEQAYLQGRISEVYRELRDTKEELGEVRKDYRKLQTHNQCIGRENDDLKAKIDNLRLQSSQEDADADAESDGDDHLPEKKKQKIKRKNRDNSESNEDDARVRYTSIYTICIFFFSNEFL